MIDSESIESIFECIFSNRPWKVANLHCEIIEDEHEKKMCTMLSNLNIERILIISLITYFTIYFVINIFFLIKYKMDRILSSWVEPHVKMVPHRFREKWSPKFVQLWFSLLDNFTKYKNDQKVKCLFNLLDKKTNEILKPYIKKIDKLSDQEQYNIFKDMLLLISNLKQNYQNPGNNVN